MKEIDKISKKKLKVKLVSISVSGDVKLKTGDVIEWFTKIDRIKAVNKSTITLEKAGLIFTDKMKPRLIHYCLLSYEKLKVGDKFLFDDKHIETANEFHVKWQNEYKYPKVIATHKQIGYFRHLPVNSSFVSEFEDLGFNYLLEFISHDCFVEMENKNEVRLLNNKVILSLK